MRRLVLTALVIFGCTPQMTLEFEVDPETQALVFVISDSTESKGWVVASPADQGLPLALSKGQVVTIHQYEETVEALGIERSSGLIRGSECPTSLPLPEPRRRERFTVTDRGWMSQGDEPTPLRLPYGPLDCLEASGCLRVTEGPNRIPVCGACRPKNESPMRLDPELVDAGAVIPDDPPLCGGMRADVELGCVPFRNACADGAWPEHADAVGTVYYVDANAVAGGDGSIVSPFQAIEAALGQVVRPDVVVVKQGEYGFAAGQIELTYPVRIVACPVRTDFRAHLVVAADVSIQGGTWTEGVEVAESADLELSSARVRGSERPAVQVIGTARLEEVVVLSGTGLVAADKLTLRDVATEELTSPAIQCQSGELDVDGLSVYTASQALDAEGCTVQLARARFGPVESSGLSLALDSTGVIQDVHLVGVDGTGSGLSLHGGSLAATELRIGDALGSSAINVAGGASLTLFDSSIQRSREGITVTASVLEVRDVRLESATESGLTAKSGAEVTVDGLGIGSSKSPVAVTGSLASLQRILIEAAEGTAVLAFGGADVEIHGLRILSAEAGLEAVGAEGAATRLFVSMAELLRINGSALRVAGARLELADVSVLRSETGLELGAGSGQDTEIVTERFDLHADTTGITVSGPREGLRTEAFRGNLVTDRLGLSVAECDPELPYGILDGLWLDVGTSLEFTVPVE